METETKKCEVTIWKQHHRDADWWAMQCEEKEPFNSLVKQIEGRRWSATHQAWLIPQGKKLKDEIKLALFETYEVNILDHKPIDNSHLEKKPNSNGPVRKPQKEFKKADFKDGKQVRPRFSTENQKAMAAYQRELVLKGFSPNTQKTYTAEFAAYLVVLKGMPAEGMNPDRIKDYLYYCAQYLKLSEATLHSRINALKFYYEQVLGREKFFWEVPRPKKKVLLPKVISEEKILEGIEKLENLKHKTLIMTAYSAGLRVSEVVGLRIEDIQSDRMQILIQQSKGKKDRMVPLSKALLHILREYYKNFRPKNWLFEGQNHQMHLSTRTAQAIFNHVFKKLGLPKGTSFHALRHSYATHLVENGIDVTFVQRLLGHQDVRTTMRYTHVSKVKLSEIESPLDRILRDKKGK